jgi:hypothetical protein
MSFNPDNVQVGLGHGKTAKDRLDEYQVHDVSGHRVIFIQVEDVFKAVCRDCSIGREIPFIVEVRPDAKRYILGEFLDGPQCTHSR